MKALVAQATSFGEGFLTFALLILPVVLFLGIATFVRLLDQPRGRPLGHRHELLRHAYLEATPELRPYFITGWHDDEAGVTATFGVRAGPGGFAHEFVTTPGVPAVVDGVLAGVLTGIVGAQLGAGTSITLGFAVAASLLTIALLAVYQYSGAVRPRAQRRARFPEEGARISDSDSHPEPEAVPDDRLAQPRRSTAPGLP